MRWQLLKSFDKIWVIDLHGSLNRKEEAPGGAGDKNVFDIKPGVSILIGVRKGLGSDTLAKVYHTDIWGSRERKSEILFSSDLQSLACSQIVPESPHYMLIPWDYVTDREFRKGFSLEDAMPVHSNGIVTGGDRNFVANDQAVLRNRFGDGADIEPLSYRPFEQSFLLNDPSKLERDRSEVMDHYRLGDNIGLLTSKAFNDVDFAHAFVTKHPSEAIFLSGTSGSNAMNFPLWLHRKNDFEKSTPNLSPRLRSELAKILGRQPEAWEIFDYIYGVLHCPAYRRKYRQALSIAYPHIPYPASQDVFRDIGEKGEQLRRLHLMEEAAIGDAPYPYHGDGDDVVATGFPRFVNGRVLINKDQYFADVPQVAWAFQVGGYQPAQKWLKDRRGQALSWDDIGRYQKIVKVLAETDRLMRSIVLPIDGGLVAGTSTS